MSFEKRQTKSGFLQFREIYSDGRKGQWLYQIYSFRGNPGEMGTCLVYAVDGKRDCAIDWNNRIFIDGRWRSPLSWHH
jgi:hypothetical protein